MSARERLPNRRPCESLEFEHAGLRFPLCAGFYRDGRIAEIFLSSHKPGSPIEAIARDAAVTVSIALQSGADLETIRQALTRDHDGGPATLLGQALDALAGACARDPLNCMAWDCAERSRNRRWPTRTNCATGACGPTSPPF
jgi:hypothetical protein